MKTAKLIAEQRVNTVNFSKNFIRERVGQAIERLIQNGEVKVDLADLAGQKSFRDDKGITLFKFVASLIEECKSNGYKVTDHKHSSNNTEWSFVISL